MCFFHLSQPGSNGQVQREGSRPRPGKSEGSADGRSLRGGAGTGGHLGRAKPRGGNEGRKSGGISTNPVHLFWGEGLHARDLLYNFLISIYIYVYMYLSVLFRPILFCGGVNDPLHG